MELKQGKYPMRFGGYIRFVPVLLSSFVQIMRPDEDVPRRSFEITQTTRKVKLF
jgi:hypothetical protein